MLPGLCRPPFRGFTCGGLEGLPSILRPQGWERVRAGQCSDNAVEDGGEELVIFLGDLTYDPNAVVS